MAEGGLRKRDRTRDTLLVAAQELVLSRGLPAITINDIAERAGVAPGTFYNYFKTREEVADAIADLLQRAYHRDVDAVTAGIDDAPRIVAASLRQTLHWISPGNAMGKLLFASGVPLARYAFGIRERSARDIGAGLKAGTFHMEDRVATQSMLSGIVVGVSMDIWLGIMPIAAIPGVTAQCIQLLGVTPAKAAKIARESLPLREAPALPLSAAELLAPVERGEVLPGAYAAADTTSMTLVAPVTPPAGGRRPRASRSLRAQIG